MLVIFDLDGTLLNTIADLATATNYALQNCGYPTHALDRYPYMVGNGVTRLLERAMPETTRTDENVAQMRKYFMEYYGANLTQYTAPYQGIEQLLTELRTRGINVAVASNKYQAAVDRLIRHFFPTIEWAAIEGQKDNVPVKPDPSIVFEILGKCPTPKSQVLYVGDSGVDMDTARRACVTSVGVTWGFRPESELREHYAEHLANSTADVLRYALEMLNNDKGVE